MSQDIHQACAETTNLLQPFVDHELGEEDRSLVLDHISRCSACAGVVREQQRIRSLLRTIGPVAAPAGLRQKVLCALDQEDAKMAQEALVASQMASIEQAVSSVDSSNAMRSGQFDQVVQMPANATARHLSRPVWRKWAERSIWPSSAVAAGLLVLFSLQNSPADRSALSASLEGVDGNQAVAGQVHTNQADGSPASTNTVARKASACAENTPPQGPDGSATRDGESDGSQRPVWQPPLAIPNAIDAPSGAVTQLASTNGGVGGSAVSGRKHRRTVKLARGERLPEYIEFLFADPQAAYYLEQGHGRQIVDVQQAADEKYQLTGRPVSLGKLATFVGVDPSGAPWVRYSNEGTFHEIRFAPSRVVGHADKLNPDDDLQLLLNLATAIEDLE